MSPAPRHPLSSTARPTRAAFTLIELLTVIAIIGILAAILIPTVGKVRQTAMAAKCGSNLRQIGGAFQLYANENRGLSPAPRKPTAPSTTLNLNPSGENWQMEVAPYTSPKLRANNMYRLKEMAAEQNTAYCPSYAALFPDSAAILATGLDTLGYGMNFNLNVGGRNLNSGTQSLTIRFLMTAISAPSRQILVGDSSDYHIDVNTASWTVVSSASKPDGYSTGAPKRHGSSARYLFADGHVQALTPEAALLILPYKQL